MTDSERADSIREHSALGAELDKSEARKAFIASTEDTYDRVLGRLGGLAPVTSCLTSQHPL